MDSTYVLPAQLVHIAQGEQDIIVLLENIQEVREDIALLNVQPVPLVHIVQVQVLITLIHTRR